MSTNANVQLLSGFNTFVISKNLEGITQEESLAFSPAGGNCINWVAGHILSARNGTLRLLGADPMGADGELTPYLRGSGPLTADHALPISRLRDDLAESSRRIAAALETVTAEALGKTTPFPAVPGGDGFSVGESLMGLQFHESYHAGQLGILRRMVGRDGAIA
jgi:hypothetical protein